MRGSNPLPGELGQCRARIMFRYEEKCAAPSQITNLGIRMPSKRDAVRRVSKNSLSVGSNVRKGGDNTRRSSMGNVTTEKTLV